MKKLNEIIGLAAQRPARRMVLVNGIDSHSLEAANAASGQGLVEVTVTGDAVSIEGACRKLGIDPSTFKIVHVTDENQAAREAVKLIAVGEADFLMKGLISTDKYMKALLNKDYGLLPDRKVLSHVAIVENDAYHKLLIVSDVAVIPYPDLKQKVAMTGYLIATARALGIENPKVAVLAPSEQVLPAITSSVDACLLARMSERGQITGGIVDGPFALDVAIDREAAELKKVNSPVAGDADCLLFPNIDAANVFYKMCSRFIRCRQAAVVVGANAPAVLTSRGDRAETKLNSIALASLLCNHIV